MGVRLSVSVCGVGEGGGGGGQLLVPCWTHAGIVALLFAFLIPGYVPRWLSCLGGLVG